MCDMNGCDKKSLPGALIYALEKIGLPRKANVLNEFGEPGHFCTSCAVRFAAQVAIHAGILSPDALKRNTRQPEPIKHYPVDSSSRLKRLYEIEASMRPTRAPVPVDDRREWGMSKLTELEVPNQRKLLWRYLESIGVKNPHLMFNWQTTK